MVEGVQQGPVLVGTFFKSQGTSGAEEGSRRAKTTEFRHSGPLERPAKGSVCGQGTWQERRSDHGEPRGWAGPAQDLHHP